MSQSELMSMTASMKNMRRERVQIPSGTVGLNTAKTLDVSFIFKGKLQAAASRSKHSDATDLLWLEERYNSALKAHTNEYDRRIVGMAMRRYNDLEQAFGRLGVDLEACKAVTRDFDPNDKMPQPELDQVQSGLMYGLRAA